MRKHIERLKNQHPAVRTRLSLMAAASVTAVIALVWLTTLPVRFGGKEMANEVQPNNTASALTAAQNIQAASETASEPTTEVIQTESESGLQVVPNPKNTTPSQGFETGSRDY